MEAADCQAYEGCAYIDCWIRELDTEGPQQGLHPGVFDAPLHDIRHIQSGDGFHNSESASQQCVMGFTNQAVGLGPTFAWLTNRPDATTQGSGTTRTRHSSGNTMLLMLTAVLKQRINYWCACPVHSAGVQHEKQVQLV